MTELSSLQILTRGIGLRRARTGPPGLDAHFQMLTQLLAATYNPYKPAVLNWPKLDAATLARVTSLPIWDIAVQTENKAAMRIEHSSPGR